MIATAPWTFVGGKGGVGKTTTAAALAVQMAAAGERVLAISIDPAHSLGDALGVELGPEPVVVPVAGGGRLEAMEVDAEFERRRFLGSRRGALLRLVERGTYLDEGDVAGFVDLALPGMDELAALLRLLEFTTHDPGRLVIDTAPTGHTLRLLELPELARGWLGALEAMEEKHQAVAGAFTGLVRRDEVTQLLEELDRDLAALHALLRDPARTRFVLVSTMEPVVLAETRRFQDELERRGIPPGGVVVNRADRAPEGAAGGGMVFVPTFGEPPVGVAALARYAAALDAAGSSGREAVPNTVRVRTAGSFDPPAGRTLHLVGGKGGVGKTTAACALAVALTGEGERRVLLLGADPAGSLGDVLGVPVAGEPREVPGVAGLEVRELDAAAAWSDFRARYREEAEQLFAGVLGGLSADADRRVVERLIDLAPPGLDELMALLEVVELLEDGSHDALVLDTAPTGHLLRLLEMPALALQWTHTLMRLLLKYREVVGLGGLAQRVLRLSRSLRHLTELLQDPARTWFLAVALPEALSVPETGRLVMRLHGLGIPVGGLLVNRALGENPTDATGAAAVDGEWLRELASISRGAPLFVAPALQSGPIGAEALRDFLSRWRALEPDVAEPLVHS